MSHDCSRPVWMCARVFVVLRALLLVWQTGIFCSFGFCQSYLLGCVVYWLVACMLELCLLSRLKDCCLFIFTMSGKTHYFVLFFHFYLVAQQASLLIWSKSVIFWVHQLAISGITICIPALPVNKMGKGWFIRQTFLLKVLANLQENKINEKSLNSRAKGIIALFTVLNAVAFKYRHFFKSAYGGSLTWC